MNSIRPVALRKKNYLFAGSHEAAQQAVRWQVNNQHLASEHRNV